MAEPLLPRNAKSRQDFFENLRNFSSEKRLTTNAHELGAEEKTTDCTDDTDVWMRTKPECRVSV
ncbi:MAG: hypothetical protein DME33_04455 [Verrucomicrobia bacterium]|nr:MAG: hypothetical protein DME33_04455 [Verrucomicrobiota bacterium]